MRSVESLFRAIEMAKRLYVGNLKYTVDFRSTYATLLDQWMHIEPEPIVNGKFEQFALV